MDFTVISGDRRDPELLQARAARRPPPLQSGLDPREQKLRGPRAAAWATAEVVVIRGSHRDVPRRMEVEMEIRQQKWEDTRQKQG